MPTVQTYTAKDGRKTFRVRVRHQGKQTSATFSTLAAARLFCKDVTDVGADEAMAMYLAAADAESMTLDELAEQFWPWKARRVRSSRTVPDYQRDYRRWIQPTFGRRRLDRITRGHVQTWVDDMLAGTIDRRPSSPKSIVDRHALLHSLFEFAAAPGRELVTANPTKGVDLPRKSSRPPKGLRPAEWQALIGVLRQMDDDAADLADFLLASGWRWSEATALPVWAVEDLGEVLWVAVEQVARRGDKGTQIVDDTKNKGSDRRTKLDRKTADMVRRRIAGKAPSDLVFTTGISPQNGLGGSQWHYGNFRRRYWDKAVEVASLSRKPTPHWLRHTAVYWLVLSGANLAEVQARIGHRHVSTTIDVYGRMLSDVQGSTLDAFALMRDGVPEIAPGAVVLGEVTG